MAPVVYKFVNIYTLHKLYLSSGMNVDHRMYNQQISLNSLDTTPCPGVKQNHSRGAFCACAWATSFISLIIPYSLLKNYHLSTNYVTIFSGFLVNTHMNMTRSISLSLANTILATVGRPEKKGRDPIRWPFNIYYPMFIHNHYIYLGYFEHNHLIKMLGENHYTITP